jgi:NADH-quinone oxidoreductase subunit L
MAAFAALLTAFYMTRQVYYVFAGTSRSSEESHGSSHATSHPHESPAVMAVPLVILAAFAVLLGFIGTPAWPWFQSFLEGNRATFSLSAFFGAGIMPIMLSSSLLVFLGLGLGWYFYGRRPIASAAAPDRLGKLQPQIYSVLSHAFFVDALYGATIIRLNNVWSEICDWLDRWVWNGAVQTVSYLVLVVAWLNNFFDASVVNSGFDEGCEGVSRGGQLLSLLQGGQVQSYMRVIGCALIALTLFLLWGVRQ